MSKHPAPTRADHRKFVEREAWTLVRNAKGGAVEHHLTYELTASDGNVLRTRISRPADKTTYGRSMWAAVLRDQLQVTEDQFWACVNDKLLPDRGVANVPTAGLPSPLVFQLRKAGVPAEEIARLNKASAMKRLEAIWTSGQGE